MLYMRETTKSVDQAFHDLKVSVKQHGFGLLHHYDLKQRFKEKGFDRPDECRVREVCNPQHLRSAAHGHGHQHGPAVPHLGLWAERQDVVGMIPPSALLGLISSSSELKQAADEVEKTTRQIVDDAVWSIARP